MMFFYRLTWKFTSHWFLHNKVTMSGIMLTHFHVVVLIPGALTEHSAPYSENHTHRREKLSVPQYATKG